MKYKELISFEPITEVIKFSRTKETDYQQTLVKTFVFSDSFRDALIPEMVKNISLNQRGESFGLQVVGNYGTGKSHLMSLVSLIAENEALINFVEDEKPKKELAKIAGQFKVLRFELGNTESLWEVMTYQITEFFEELGISFSFEALGNRTFGQKLKLMMDAFESKFPDKGLLLVVDEMLAYLKGRSTADKLNTDLSVLQAFGQACDKSKFKFIFGVQEMIYHSSEFQFAAEMLQKVNNRFREIVITKEEVAYIVKKRLLKKNEHQKNQIRKHLDGFLKLFTDMHAKTDDYIELFPVHPSYFENFEKIRIGKSQREILKTLSAQFNSLLDLEVPKDNPGLLTYDAYWDVMGADQSLMAIPDVRKVKQITDTIYDKIESYFTGGRVGKKPVARRIVNACAIKILQHELSSQNGTNAEQLVDDLCLTDKLAMDREFLIDIIDTAANNILTATSGQYFDKDSENGEYHLRIEGGINFDQKIKDYAATMADSQKDEYFFKFLEVNLPLDHDTYRTGFRIWDHTIEWESHKTYREGYIFFGNPNEKSTTHPQQHFYMYFMPIFDASKKKRNHEEDEVYFIFDALSEEFKQLVTLYGAALALEGRADSSQKPLYRQKIEDINRRARKLFDEEYVRTVQVDYKGKELPLSGYRLPGSGATKEQVFSAVASEVFEKWFSNERPDYPNFSQLTYAVSKDNYERLVKQALNKVINPQQTNRDGEGILSGLGCWVPGQLDYSHSPYAKSLLRQLKEKGEGKVLNRDEMLELVKRSENLWISKDFKIEAELQFVVMAVLAALGEIEINLHSGKDINSTNLNELKELQKHDYYSFTHIKAPKGLNLAALKLMFTKMVGRDLSNHLNDPDTYTVLVTAANEWARKTVTLQHKVQGGYTFAGIEIISPEQGAEFRRDFTAFSGFCDKLANYTSQARIRNFHFTIPTLKDILPVKDKVQALQLKLQQLDDLQKDLTYLQQCKQYATQAGMKQAIDAVLHQLNEVLDADSEKATRTYISKLAAVKQDYAEWYLDRYLACRISEKDDVQKAALLNSDEKQVCDILKEADFLSAATYLKWNKSLTLLKPADPKVNKALILTAPYQDFNPHEYEGLPVPSVRALREELHQLFEEWEQTLKNVLDDPAVKKNMNLLDLDSVKLLSDFKAGKQQLTKQNALRIRNAIMSLHKGLDKVELTVDSMKAAFNKPLTPDEAIEAFKAYIDQIARGKERDKIRIILK
ncbi:MAG: hypothetical protein JJU35_15230 [Balneolales bacterium]|nr:hypothetical protein [Balneolales bacterium]